MVATGPPFCFAGFGTDRLGCKQTMKTARRENPKREATVPTNRAHGAEGQNRSCSNKRAAKQEHFQPLEAAALVLGYGRKEDCRSSKTAHFGGSDLLRTLADHQALTAAMWEEFLADV
jgi:hypothetical protein